MNPLMQMMPPAMGGINPQAVQQIRQVIGSFKAMKNPYAMLAQNPQMAGIMQMCQGRDPREVFYAQCKQRGADPSEIINQLNQFGLDLK